MTTTELDQIRIMLVDDQELVRDAFGMIISSDPTINLVGALDDGESAVEMVPVLKPNVIVMDVKMPGLNGIVAAQRIREVYPDIGIILLSSYDDTRYITEFLKDDPRGKSYLLKQTLATKGDLVRTIHDVAAGRTVLDPIMVEKLTSQAGLPDRSPLKLLTRREMEVLSLRAKACTNNTIGSILYIQPRTVERHINSIFSKLGISADDGQHARVQTVLAYLKATGQTHDDAIG